MKVISVCLGLLFLLMPVKTVAQCGFGGPNGGNTGGTVGIGCSGSGSGAYVPPSPVYRVPPPSAPSRPGTPADYAGTLKNLFPMMPDNIYVNPAAAWGKVTDLEKSVQQGVDSYFPGYHEICEKSNFLNAVINDSELRKYQQINSAIQSLPPLTGRALLYQKDAFLAALNATLAEAAYWQKRRVNYLKRRPKATDAEIYGVYYDRVKLYENWLRNALWVTPVITDSVVRELKKSGKAKTVRLFGFYADKNNQIDYGKLYGDMFPTKNEGFDLHKTYFTSPKPDPKTNLISGYTKYQLYLTLSGAVYHRCREVGDLYVKAVRQTWSLSQLITVPQNMVEMRISALDIWDAAWMSKKITVKSQRTFAADARARKKKYEELAASFVNFSCAKSGSVKAAYSKFSGVNPPLLDPVAAKTITEDASSLCGSRPPGKSKKSEVTYKDLVDKDKRLRKRIDGCELARQVYTEALEEQRRIDKAIADQNRCKCVAEDSPFGYYGTMGRWAGICDKSKNRFARLAACSGAAFLEPFGKLECSAQKLGCESVYYPQDTARIAKDAGAVAGSAFLCFLRMYPTAKIPPFVKVMSSVSANAATRAAGIQFELPKDAKLMGYVVDGVFITAKTYAKGIDTLSGSVITMFASKSVTNGVNAVYVVEKYIPLVAGMEVMNEYDLKNMTSKRTDFQSACKDINRLYKDLARYKRS